MSSVCWRCKKPVGSDDNKLKLEIDILFSLCSGCVSQDFAVSEDDTIQFNVKRVLSILSADSLAKWQQQQCTYHVPVLAEARDGQTYICVVGMRLQLCGPVPELGPEVFELLGIDTLCVSKNSMTAAQGSGQAVGINKLIRVLSVRDAHSLHCALVTPDLM